MNINYKSMVSFMNLQEILTHIIAYADNVRESTKYPKYVFYDM